MDILTIVLILKIIASIMDQIIIMQTNDKTIVFINKKNDNKSDL